MKYFIQSFVLLFIIIAACTSEYSKGITNSTPLPDKIDFNFHIKPILSDRCFNCHGPDEGSRKAGLRLDLEESAFSSLSSGKGKVIHPNNPSKSELIKRIKSDVPDYRMPPPESNLEISDYELALLEKWIDQGAEWKKHWSFIPPEKVEVPENNTDIWTNMNEIDHFILKKANAENISVKQQAIPERLLRRVYFDLTGLPPSVEEIDKFLSDPSEAAYESIVDHLLSTEAHAERLTMEWLDVARYADSHGLHADGWRNMHPWRDWVIDAFKSNMSYKDFIQKQLAGDMLANATREDIIATAFNRNHPMTAEGGAVNEEWRLNYVFDRAETMSTAVLGLTVGCAKCHDHKYDPISQKDFYQLSSFFNNIKEVGMTGDDGNYGPILMLTDEKTQEKLIELNNQIAKKESDLILTADEINETKSFIEGLGTKPQLEGLIAHVPFDKSTSKTNPKDKKSHIQFDGNKNYTTNGDGKLVEGKYGKSLVFEKDFSTMYISDIGQFETYDPFTVMAWINTIQKNPKKTQTILGNSGEKNNFWRGWDMYLDEYNFLNARLISTYPHNYIHVRSAEIIDTSIWTHVSMSYNGSASASGLNIYINGVKSLSEIVYDDLSKTILTVGAGLSSHPHTKDNRPLTIGVSGRKYTGEDGLYYGKIDDIKVFNQNLSAYEVSIAAGIEAEPSQIDQQIIVAKQVKKKTLKALKNLRKEKLELIRPVQEMMVMKENDRPNKMYVYHRGEYDKPGEEVYAGTPAAVLDFPEKYKADRLGLVNWIFDDKNPLPARVAVNRYWQVIFGNGLIATPDDFGLQGSLPSHPDLLDWLAIDFKDSGWNLRELLKKMVMSSTYRQSSNCEPEEREKDPDNILLARGSSYRLQAEMIRDNALAASGLLETKIGGASVRPYQPEGLWIELGNFSKKLLYYKENKGDSLYRRSMYTMVRRTSPHPMMTTFDAPSREVCIMKRENTSTPLQALVLMNDPQFVEAAKVLAQRMQLEGGISIEDQIVFAFKCSTGRSPNAKEKELLVNLYTSQVMKYAKAPEEAKQLLRVGDYIIDDTLDPAKTAALTMVSNTILNHDDTYMKR